MLGRNGNQLLVIVATLGFHPELLLQPSNMVSSCLKLMRQCIRRSNYRSQSFDFGVRGLQVSLEKCRHRFDVGTVAG